MQIRLGISRSFRRYSRAAARIGAPLMVSANALARASGFRAVPDDLFAGADVALDSAGFVAMQRYGGYRWSMAEYLSLAGAHRWAWWSAMDYCCEPEIARDAAAVRERVNQTCAALVALRAMAGDRGIAPPLPVLQGWRPADYRYCADKMRDLPDLIGVGSVCRRAVGGPDGVVAIIDALDRALPRRVGLHLFGVKGDAIPLLLHWPRIVSVDSMAWDFRSRKAAWEQHVSCTIEFRVAEMTRWYRRQQAKAARPRPAQLELGA